MSGKRLPLAIYLCVLAVALLPYLRTLSFEFTYDDGIRIQKNPAVISAEPVTQSLETILLSPTYPGDLYRPLTELSFWLNQRLLGPAPWGFHLLSALLHAGVALLALLLFLRIMPQAWLAVAAALLFAVHPINSETICNASYRGELLAAFFGLAGLLCLFQISARRLTLVILFFLLSALSKESGLVFILLGPLLVYQVRRCLPPRLLSLLLVPIIYLILRRLALGELIVSLPREALGSENPLAFEPLLRRVLPSLVLFGRYLSRLAFPLHLSADYSEGFTQFWSRLHSLEALGAFSASILWGWVIVRYRRTLVSSFAIWVALSFLLSINLFFTIGTIMADRLAYSASLGFAALVVCTGYALIETRPSLRPALFTALIVLALLYSWKTSSRVLVWRNNRTLFLTTLRQAPDSPKSLENAAKIFYYDLRQNDRAEDLLKRTLLLEATRIDSVKLMIDISLDKADFAAARHWCLAALRLEPQNSALKEILRNLESAANSADAR
jgi:protein O-mannosyl-transferase